MKNRYFTSGDSATAMSAMVLLVFVSTPKAQQRGGTMDAAAKPTPKMAHGHLDFTGFRTIPSGSSVHVRFHGE